MPSDPREHVRTHASPGTTGILPNEESVKEKSKKGKWESVRQRSKERSTETYTISDNNNETDNTKQEQGPVRQ